MRNDGIPRPKVEEEEADHGGVGILCSPGKTHARRFLTSRHFLKELLPLQRPRHVEKSGVKSRLGNAEGF